MRIIIAPDKFAGTLTAVQASEAIAEGWATSISDVEPHLLPLSDGGPGFVDVLHAAVGGTVHPVTVSDPRGEPVLAQYLLCEAPAAADDTQHSTVAYVESAQACGLHLVAEEVRNPEYATSFGVGQLIHHAVRAGADTVVVGLGGSATNDGGAGMLAALGATADEPLNAGAAPLARLSGKVDVDQARSALSGVRLVAATDVDSPLVGTHGASAVFGPQKGADAAAVRRMDQALTRFAEATERSGELRAEPGAGAAGGLGFGLLLLDGQVESGVGVVLNAVALSEYIATSDLVITGEGSFDRQSLRGKLPHGVAAAARAHRVPCLILAGQSTVAADEAHQAGIAGIHTLVDQAGSTEAALAEPERHLRELAAVVARSWRQAEKSQAAGGH
ncbi:glycerate kinase [Lipingzhangella sp. LS1_29]|uniref:Glycerate kinase n=1 Tax=Lipingzhangella rawalii TaxID=2055835 RepID=A0ABU2H1E9_9ACTN|nr:glycerate kinase [Lipingzhangella rawalii]MDS1268680.1 glycerate kinase [Lipingzhangella rawalii]